MGFEPTILWCLPFRLQVILQTKGDQIHLKTLSFPPFLLLVVVDHLSEQTCSSSHLSHHSSSSPLLASSACLDLGSIKSSHAPRGPAGPPNASAALRGNGAFMVGEEPLQKGVKVAQLSGYLSRWVCLFGVTLKSSGGVGGRSRTHWEPSFIVDVWRKRQLICRRLCRSSDPQKGTWQVGDPPVDPANDGIHLQSRM